MFKFTNFFKNRFKEFGKLKGKITGLFKDELKKESEQLTLDFREAILKDNIGLARLKPKTIDRKKRLKLSNPKKPLYGKGEASNKSYANMMSVKKITNGYIITPKSGQHHSKKVTLKKLFVYHEDAQREHTEKRPAMQIILDRSKKEKQKRKINIDPKTFDVRITKK
jgi:hypothetical protein